METEHPITITPKLVKASHVKADRCCTPEEVGFWHPVVDFIPSVVASMRRVRNYDA